MLTKHIYARYLERKKKNSKMPGFAVSAIESIRRNPRFAKFNRMYRSIPCITSSTTSSPKKVIVESFQSAVSALFSVSTFISLYSIDTVNEFRAAAHDTFGPKWFSLPSRPIDALTPEIDLEAAADAAFHQLMAEEELIASSRSGNGINVDHDGGSKKMKGDDRVSSPSSPQSIEPGVHQDAIESSLSPIDSRSDDDDVNNIPMDIPMEAQPARCVSTMKVVVLIVIGLLAVLGCTAVYLSDGGTAMEPLSFHEDTSQWVPPMEFVDLQGYHRRFLVDLRKPKAPLTHPMRPLTPPVAPLEPLTQHVAPLEPLTQPPAASELPLSVRLSNGHTVPIKLSPDSTVADVTAALRVAEGWPEMLPQVVSVNGRLLPSGQSLTAADVHPGDTLDARPLDLLIVHHGKTKSKPADGVAPIQSHSHMVQVVNQEDSASGNRGKPIFERQKVGDEKDEYEYMNGHQFTIFGSADHIDRVWNKFIYDPDMFQQTLLMRDLNGRQTVTQMRVTLRKV